MERRKIGLIGPDVVKRAEWASDNQFVSMPVAGRINADTGEITWAPGFEWLGKTGTPMDEIPWRGMQR